MTALDPLSATSQAGRPDRALARLLAGVLLPPAAWVGDFMARYFAIRFANVHDRRWPMAVATAASVALVLVGAGLCRRALHDDSDGTRGVLARWGLALAAFFLLLILAQAFPTLVLRAKEIT